MLDFKQIEEEILKFWAKDKTFEKSLEKTKKGKPYFFYDGPPFATGLPHYGHILGSTTKDAIPRFWTMKGRYVKRRWGWDCHGLPIENIAEEELGIKTKDEIEKMGIKKFNDFCRSKVLTYVGEWKKTVDRIARWVDFDNSYKTMDNDYIESVWWAFKQLWDKGFIYEGEKILMYCSRCETPLSKSEVSMDNSYKTVKDNTITVKFKLKGEDGYALAWTTTPWTLPSNLALTVNPKLDYSYVKDLSDGTVYILGKDLISNYFKNESEYEIVKTVKGKELVGKKYKPLFPYFSHFKNSFKIISGDFVTAEDGTGIVHTAPAFGEDDYNVCKKNLIDFVSPVDDAGRFTEDIKDFVGLKVTEANPKVIEFLKKEGKIVKVEKKEHEYPFCYRCETPLIYKALPAWFVNIQKIKPRLLKLNKKINYVPKFLKEGRVKHNLETAPDWNISRNRYWASPIPIWKCKKCDELRVVGSIEDLKKESINLNLEKLDLHKDFMDGVFLKCSCGEKMERVPEVLDCWFESGSMPFAQFHYPFENKKEFENSFPAQFVSEYIAQTRAWFYYMNVISAIIFDEIPFENVLTTGTILAEDGEKMSKSKKNYPDPWLLFEKYGVDALRFYLLSSQVMNADNLNFSERGVEDAYKKVIVLLYNVNKFYSLYKDEKFDKTSLSSVDKWMISRTNDLIKKVSKYMEEYNTIKACSEIFSFIDELSTWYVKISRDRFVEKDGSAKDTLVFALENFAKVCAPLMPFVSENVYQTIYGKKDSVHLQDWPIFDSKKINSTLQSEMDVVREVVSKGLAVRDKAQIGLKWPLALADIKVPGKISKEFQEIIARQLNVKKVKIVKSDNLAVKLDTEMTPELEAEGFAREVSRKVQALRKNTGLIKEDNIDLTIVADAEFKEVIEKNKEMIMERTGSKNLEIVVDKPSGKYDGESEEKVKGKEFLLLLNKL